MGAPLVAHFRQARIFFDDRCGDGAELGHFRMIFGIGGKQALPEHGEFRHGRKSGIDEFELRAGTAGKDGAQPIVRVCVAAPAADRDAEAQQRIIDHAGRFGEIDGERCLPVIDETAHARMPAQHEQVATSSCSLG